MQAILFDKRYWTQQKARKYIHANSYKPIKPVHITDNYLRYRLREPVRNGKYRTIHLGNHVKAIKGGSLYSLMANNHDLINGIVGGVHALGSLAALAGIGYAIKKRVEK
jgi:hypothetical protein